MVYNPESATSWETIENTFLPAVNDFAHIKYLLVDSNKARLFDQTELLTLAQNNKMNLILVDFDSNDEMKALKGKLRWDLLCNKVNLCKEI